MKEKRIRPRMPLGSLETLEGRALLSMVGADAQTPAPAAFVAPTATPKATDSITTPSALSGFTTAWSTPSTSQATVPGPTPGPAQPADSTPTPMNESSFKAITAGPFSGGQLSLWAIDGDGNLWGQWQTGSGPGAAWSGWQKEATPAPLQKVAVAQLADGRLEMWAIDRSGNLWTQRQPSTDPTSGWGSWQEMSTPAALQGGTIAALSGGRLQLWGVGKDGSLWTQAQNSTDLLSTWSSWTQVKTPTPLKDVAAGYSDRLLTLYAVDQNNVLLTSQKSSNDPSAPFGDWVYWKQTAQPVQSIVTARLSPDVLQVWGVDSQDGLLDSGYVYGGTIGPSWGRTLGPTSPAPPPTQDVTDGQLTDGRLELWATGSDGSLWTETQTGPGVWGAWSGWQQVSTSFKLPVAQPAASTPAPTPTTPSTPTTPTTPSTPTTPTPAPTPTTPTPAPTSPSTPAPAPTPTPAPTPIPAPATPSKTPTTPTPPTTPAPQPSTPPTTPTTPAQSSTTTGTANAPAPAMPAVSVPASAAPTNPAPTPPSVVGVQPIRARKRGLTSVVLTFSEPMSPISVSNLGGYNLTTTIGRGRRQRSVPVGISGAIYNEQANTVTLTLTHPLGQGPLYLAIGAGALSGQNGATLPANFSIRVA